MNFLLNLGSLHLSYLCSMRSRLILVFLQLVWFPFIDESLAKMNGWILVIDAHPSKTNYTV